MIFWAVTTDRNRHEPFCYHWTHCINTRVYICLFCRLIIVIHVYIILDIDKQRTAPQIAGLTASDRTARTSQGRRIKRREKKEMTYKAVVAGMLERDSSKWIDKLLKEHGIKFNFTCSEIEELTQEKDDIYYTCKTTIYGSKYSILPVSVYVGGVVNERGIYHSVVWKNKEHDICWMAVEKTREELGITEFKIA